MAGVSCMDTSWLTSPWRDRTMRRLLLILLATAPLTSCQYLSAGEDIAIIDPFEGAGETIAEAGGNIVDAVEAIDGDAEAEPFAGEVEEVPVVTADLIPSTDPEARTSAVEQSRIDPFAMLPIPLEPEPIVVPTAARGNRGSNSGGNAAVAAKPSVPTPTPPPVSIPDQNEPLVRPSAILPLPRIPQPQIAPTISVSGIIQLGGEPYAIVSSGNEPERYVRVGDRLAGGSVRVKRIDTMAFEPQVILEENGIEVSRPVNSSAEEAAEEATDVPLAALPARSESAVPSPAGSLPLVVPPVTPPQATLPAVSTPTRADSQLPAPGVVPNSLLLLPPGELTSQVTLPNMRISVPGTV